MSQSLVKTFCFAIAMMMIGLSSARADTTMAYCKIYSDKKVLLSALPCQFSQYHGDVYLNIPGEKTISLFHKGLTPGYYADVHGNKAYRQKGLGKEGVIFKLGDRLVYIYWQFPSHSEANLVQPKMAKITPIGIDEVGLEVVDTRVNLKTKMHRLAADIFVHRDNNYLVVFSADTGHVYIVDNNEGKVLYDYFTNPIPTFEDPSTMCIPYKEPC